MKNIKIFNFRNKKRRKISSLSLLQNLLSSILLLYFLIGCFLGITRTFNIKPRTSEVFPIFSWFLFHKVRQEKYIVYNIIIHQHNNQIFEPGIPFKEADDSIIKTNKQQRTTNNVIVHKLINRMGNSYLNNHEEEFIKLRRVFEGTFLKGKIKYELVQQEYSLLERYKTGEVKNKSLGFFTN